MKNVLLSADSRESHSSELALLDKFKKFFALFSVCFIFLLAANDILNFSYFFEDKGTYVIKLFNYYGNSAITLLPDRGYGSYQGKINTSGLSNGIYLMTIEKDNYIIAIKNFVIAK
jgi:hypothetical protein